MSLLFTLIPLFFFILFVVLYKVNRTSLIPSFVFTVFMISLVGVLGMFLYNSIGNIFLRLVFIILTLLFIFIITFGIYILIAFLLLSTRVILNKERRNLSHSLSLILVIILISFVMITTFIDISGFSITAQVLIYSVYGIIIYYFIHITHYIIATILCNLSNPKKNQDYIIVHGCGLKEGNVTTLLARRLDKAIEFYNKQKETYHPPKLVLSGGQGIDEPRPEAQAMKDYVILKGIPEADILLEDRSTTTFENMTFSKEIIDKDSNGKPYNCIYATSNFHLFRTGIYAKRAGLKINGIGSKTAWYYLPNALLREYLAYIIMYWKRNLILLLIVTFLINASLIYIWFIMH